VTAGVAAPVDADLFASLDPPRLAGSRCTSCGTVAFPAQTGCARCSGDDVEIVALPDRGSLWTFTSQDYEPKAPYRAPETGFEPYGVGYVDLGNVIVEGRLVGDSFAIGDPMRLVLITVPSGTTYAFERA
jgi:uncharacterized OB-fold protein